MGVVFFSTGIGMAISSSWNYLNRCYNKLRKREAQDNDRDIDDLLSRQKREQTYD